MTKILGICLFFLVFIQLTSKAQTVVSGIVKNKSDVTLSGASTVALNTETDKRVTVISNDSGIFRFSNLVIGGPYEFIVSYIGMRSDTLRGYYLKNDSRVTLSVILEEKNSGLSDMVIVGYGSQNRNIVSGAVSQVAMDHLSSRSVSGVGDVLQGKAPGVTVVNNSGDPTDVPKVNIRGLGGVNGENPLYVIDGSIYSGTPNINPNDIESISVLKDGAAAIYGSRASGGVILITTKKGKNGKLNLTLDAKVGWQKARKLLQSLNAAEFAQVVIQADDAAGIAKNDAFNADIYPDGQITRTNWIKSIFRTAPLQDYNLKLSGGNEKSTYYMGFDYRNADGILLNTYSKRYNFRINSEHKITDWLKIGENMSYSYSNGNGANTTDDYTGAIIAAIFYPPSISLLDSAGKYSGLPSKYAGSYGDVINPYAYLKRLDVSNPINIIRANPYAEIKLVKGLKFRSNFSYTKLFDDSKSFQTRILEIGKIFDFNQENRYSNTTNDILAEQTLSYENRFGENHIDAIAGYSYQKTSSEGWSAYAQGFSNEDESARYFVNASQYYLPGEFKNTQAIESYFARVNYDYAQKYLLSLIGRRDGSSLVAKKNHFENFGSVSGDWVISKESFMKNIQWLSNLKLRGSYGRFGNLGSLPSEALNPTLLQSTLFMGLNPTQGFGYYENLLPSPDLKWANSKQTNIGFDFGVLNNRLTLSADYYIKKISNMLMLVPLSGTTGVDGQWQNGGEAEDKGFEFGLSYSSDQTKKFQYSMNASLTTLQDKLLSLAGGLTSLTSSDFPNVRGTLNPIRYIVGSPINSFYLIKTAGLFQSQDEIDKYVNTSGDLIQPNAKPGDIKFVDANHDGKIDNNDRVVAGNGFPKITYNYSLNLSYEGFDFNVFLQGVSGNKIFNALKYTGLNAGMGQNYNMLKDILNAWTPTHTNTDIPRIVASDANGNFGNNSDFYLENGNYLRVKSATLGYTLPARLMNKIKL